MFKNARVGDKVWSFVDGWGRIIEIKSGSFPINVEFEDNGKEDFSIEGKKLHEEKYPTLFWDEIVFEVPKKQLPDLKVDTQVIVWHTGGTKYRMHFKEFDDGGNIICFADGATFWSARRVTDAWGNWELAD